jgi:hypothetical protein
MSSESTPPVQSVLVKTGDARSLRKVKKDFLSGIVSQIGVIKII